MRPEEGRSGGWVRIRVWRPRRLGSELSQCSNNIEAEDAEEVLDIDLRGLDESPEHLNTANHCSNNPHHFHYAIPLGNDVH